MTLYRHFASKDELVAEYLRETRASMATVAGTPRGRASRRSAQRSFAPGCADMADQVADADERGCALANAAVELPDKAHPARRVIEEFKPRSATAWWSCAREPD